MIEDLSSNKFDVNQLLFSFLGITMIIVGNIMPKLRMNSIVGLKTRWSLKNEEVWKKSQRFGGISYIVGGAAIVGICFFAKGIYCFLLTTGIITILMIVDVFYTYQAAKYK